MATTIEERSTPAAASATAFEAGIVRFRKKWSLPAMKRATAATSAAGSSSSIRAGISSRSSSEVPARLRLWPSSPIWSAWAIIARRSIGSRRARPNTRASTSRIHARRSSTDASLAPYRSTLPSPSLNVQNARLPWAAFSITHIGIEALTTPAIGPTAPRSWQGPNSKAPDAAMRSASDRSPARPS